MSTLGRFEKQPFGVDIYSIQYADDLETGDSITGTWQMLRRKTDPLWNGVTQTGAYTALVTDTLIVTSFSVTLPSGAPDGTRISVSNKSQSAGITVGTFAVPASAAVMVSSLGGVWSVEANTDSILVDVLGDQRARTFFYGGVSVNTYEVTVVTSSSEGRVLTDNFTVKVKES